MSSSITNLRSSITRRFLGLLTGATLLSGIGSANDLLTSFEFPDSGDSFVLGTAPNRVFFDGAPTQIVGILELYRSGFYAWLAAPGVTTTMTFETPAGSLEVFARLENAQVSGMVELLDANGNVVSTVIPSATAFTSIQRPAGAPPIAQVRIQNTGSTGFVSVDDITYCAATATTSIGSNFCGPAVPNSSGLPATLSAIGSSFVTANNMVLRAEQLPTNVFGLFIVSTTQGFVAGPGGSDGNLCLGGSIGRFTGPGQIQNSGGSGSIELTIDLTEIPTPSGTVSVLSGDTWNFQTWTRDTVAGVPTSNLTTGLEIQFN